MEQKDKSLAATGSIKNKIVAPALQRERDNLAFDQTELCAMLFGDELIQKKHGEVLALMKKHPELQNTFEFREMSIVDQQTNMWEKIRFMHKNYPETESRFYAFPYFGWQEFMQGKQIPTCLHYALFASIFNVMSNDEQRAYWIPLIDNHKILGCYAQTELGHGSDVGMLETTATLDKTTDEFVINSPTTSSAKWWPGDMGRFSTHALAMARCVIDGKDYGVHPFVVEMRDMKTFKHLPGVDSGDMGIKYGFNNKDNGWATFDQVRIPRTHMLMGMARVEKDGKFSVSGDPRALYASMMLIRNRIVDEMYMRMFEVLTITLRYAAVRLQGATIDKSKEERQILNYQTFQHRVVPVLAKAYVQAISSNYARRNFTAMMDDLKEKKFHRMETNHHILSGCKAVFTEEAWLTMDICRRACGGAGYQAQSGLPEIMDNTSPNPTFEGENTVMLLQACRYVMKVYADVIKNPKKVVPFPFTYISKIEDLLSMKDRVKSVDDLLNLDVLEQALAVRSAIQIKQTAIAISKSKAPAMVKDNELFSQMKVEMAKSHIKYVMFHICRAEIEEKQWKDVRIKPILLEVMKVAALSELTENSAPIFDAGFFTPGAYKLVAEAQDIMIAKIRPHLIPLTETTAFDDVQIPSNIGNFYGDIYETQLELAKKAPLNMMDKKTGGVPPQWENYVKPYLHEDTQVKAKL